MAPLGLGLGLINYASNAGALIGRDPRFIITVKTDNAGTSASNQFTLPWIGTYDVEWGDGSSDVGVSGTQTHTYASAGTYDVAVTAASGTIRFANGGDKAKLLDIKNWGAVEWDSLYESFYGCSNLSVNATDIPYITNVTLCSRAFRNCTSLTSLNDNGWDVSSITSFASMLQGCTSLNSINFVDWDTSVGVNFANFIFSCSSLKADLSGLDINSVTNFNDFATNTNINETGTTTNYDNTLISWAAQTPKNNIVINFGTAKYSNAAAAARELLTRAVVDGGYGWTITDGGGVDLLDTYTGAAAAYSLRTIKSSTTKVVRVRADVVGQPEQDFTAAEITDGTLATFVGAGNNGYVVTWYDQSGNGNHATQGTASNQPQIVASGVVNLVNGMPAVQFDGTDDFLYRSTNFLGGSAGSGFSVSSFDNASAAKREIIYGMQDNTGARYDFLLARQSTSNVVDFYVEGDPEIGTGTITDTNQHLLTALYVDTAKRDLYNNGGILTSFANVSQGILDDGTAFHIGNDIGSTLYNLQGLIQEIILYPTDESSNRTNIEGNINGYYSIY